MSRTPAERIADVRRVLEAAKRVRGHEALLGAELAKTTGLSVEGVHLALHEHLESEATDEQLRLLVATSGDAERVTVILSANVFVGGLRALAIARAAALEVIVRPSTREPIFPRALVHELSELGDKSVTVVNKVDVATIDRGEIHVYGRDETIADIRKRARVPVRGHGTGLGIAVVTDEPIEDAAREVARDVVPFDQRGCLSPRIVLVRGDRPRAHKFGRALFEALDEWRTKVPRGVLADDERAAAARYVGTLAFAGEVFESSEHAVGVADEITLPPPGRHVHVVPFSTGDDLARAVAPLAKWIAAIGGGAGLPALDHYAPFARRLPLGRMQRPPLDGPVDLRPSDGAPPSSRAQA